MICRLCKVIIVVIIIVIIIIGMRHLTWSKASWLKGIWPRWMPARRLGAGDCLVQQQPLGSASRRTAAPPATVCPVTRTRLSVARGLSGYESAFGRRINVNGTISGSAQSATTSARFSRAVCSDARALPRLRSPVIG